MWQIATNSGYRSKAYHIKEIAELAQRGSMPFSGRVMPADNDNEPCFSFEHEKDLYKLLFNKAYDITRKATTRMPSV